MQSSLMAFLVSEDQREDRAPLVCLDSQVNLASLVCQVRRAVRVQ